MNVSFRAPNLVHPVPAVGRNRRVSPETRHSSKVAPHSGLDPQRTGINGRYRKAYLRRDFERIEQLSGNLLVFRVRDGCKWGEFLQKRLLGSLHFEQIWQFCSEPLRAPSLDDSSGRQVPVHSATLRPRRSGSCGRRSNKHYNLQMLKRESQSTPTAVRVSLRSRAW
jgi:hypothetical protein